MADIPEILQQAQVSSQGQALLPDATALTNGPERLFAAGLDLDAVRLLAYTLPARQAVWWGCLCAWHARGEPWPPVQEQALTAAVEWVLQPTAAMATAALAAVEKADLTNAAGCVARAAAACGSLADSKTVRASPLAARAVQGCALYAYLERQRTEPDFTYRPLAALGLQVARGEARWDQPSVQRRSS